jgi:hypothetical protein
MTHQIKKVIADDGTTDDDYTVGRPVTTYVSVAQHLRLLLLKGRVDRTGAVDVSYDELEAQTSSVAATG